VVVVDNASEDGSLEWARTQESGSLQVIANGDVGFCVGVNVGFRAARTPYILNVSPDVRLEPNYVAECLRVMKAGRRIGVVGGKLLRATSDGEPVTPSTIDTAGHLPHRNGTVTERGHGEADTGQFDHEDDIFGVTAAAALYRAEVVEDISFRGMFFDETFWAYKDDIDICWRAWRWGWRVRYVPSAIAYHQRGFAGGGLNRQRRRSIPLKLRIHSFSNRHLLLIHNAPLSALLRNCLHIAWYEIRALGWVLLKERELLPAYGQTIRRARHAMALRRDSARRRPISTDPWMSFIRRN
jgi:GT2 family glycosyltransferase